FSFLLSSTSTPAPFSLSLHDALPILSHPLSRYPSIVGERSTSSLEFSSLQPRSAASGSLIVAHWLATLANCPACSSLAEEMRNADRKSTRLNSSHVSISYAVFFLKKK